MTVGTLMDILGGIERELHIGAVSSTEIEIVNDANELVCTIDLATGAITYHW